MIKPASALCNMGCTYCFYTDVAAARAKYSMGMMTTDTAAKLIEHVFVDMMPGDVVHFAFQGGEPTLAGLAFYQFFVAAVKEARPPGVRVFYAIQTNGLLVDDDWCQFFKAHKFLVGLSLDGDGALHNSHRVDAQGKGTHNQVMAAKKRLDAHGVAYNILCVLTGEMARRGKRVWDFLVKEKIEHVQFIPCLAPLAGASPMALTGLKFFQFYSDLFTQWRRSPQVSVRLFEDLAALLLAGQPVTCGVSGRCMLQIVVEADGSVYPCDFYVLDRYRVGNIAEDSLAHIFDASVNGLFLQEADQLRETQTHCKSCPYHTWCQGGCRRMEKAVYGQHCGMKMFLDAHLQELLNMYR